LAGTLEDYLPQQQDDQAPAATYDQPQGALSRPRPQAGGYGYPMGALGGYGAIDPLYALAATDTSAMRPEDFQPSAYTKRLFDASSDLLGGEGAAPLGERFNQLRDSRDQAASSKMAAIERAMANLEAVHQGQGVNIPLLAAAGALLGPTSNPGGFGASLSNAAAAAVPALQNQRKIDEERALLQGKLEVEKAGVQGDLTQEQFSDYLKQLQLGEQFGAAGARSQAGELTARARQRAAELAAQSRVTAAGLRADGTVNAAQIRADANSVQFLGNDPADPTIGRFLYTKGQNAGKVVNGPAAAGKGLAGGDPAKIREARILQQEYAKPENGGMVLSFPDAYGMARSSVNNPHQWVSEVQAAQRLISAAHPEYKPDQLLDMAREQVMKTRGQQPATGRPAQGAAGAAPNQTAPKAVRPATKDELDRARDAITRGAPRDQVEKRFKDNGIDPSGL
jgi:hypothetical protein